MDEDSNGEGSNSSAKRSKLESLGAEGKEAETEAEAEAADERKDISSTNDVEMSDKPEATESVPNSNDDDDDSKKDTVSAAVEDSGYVENDNKKEEQAPEEAEDKGTDRNEPGTSNRIRRPNRRNNRAGNKRRNYRTREISSSEDSDDNDEDQAADSASKSNSSSGSESEVLVESEDNNENSFSSIYSLDYPAFDAMDSDDSNSSNKTNDNTIPDILQITHKPEYKWNQYRELMSREQGLPGKERSSITGSNPIAFQNRFYGSRHVIEKMRLLHHLEKHQGCVNSLHFNKAGNFLVSGSDDLKIILWNWSANKIAYAFNSGHNSNVFQTKFVELAGGINIVSSGRDGQVRHAAVPPSGSRKVISRVLLKHVGAVHKLAPCVNNPYEILTAGEDGHVVRCDLREKPIERVVTVKVKKRKVPLYSIAHHPLDPEFCVCGRDQFVRVYDKRNTKIPVYMMCPQHLEDKKALVSHITCAVYNSTGSEILASYSDEDIYLFNNKCYLTGHYSHRYKGHNNNKTIKGVNFFGLNSEYIVSGSDCGNFFFWDKNTESIINWIKGDTTGVVNCLEPHPSFPVLASSGLDHDVKIWVPFKDDYPPPMEGLAKCVRHNMKRSVMTDNDLFDDRTFFFFVRQCLRNRRTATTDESFPNVQDLVSSSSEDDDNGCGSGDENLQFRTMPCTHQ